MVEVDVHSCSTKNVKNFANFSEKHLLYATFWKRLQCFPMNFRNFLYKICSLLLLGMFLLLLIRYLLVQSQQLRQRSNKWNQLKVNNTDTRTTSGLILSISQDTFPSQRFSCSKSTIETLEKVNDAVLVFLLLILNIFYTFFYVSIVYLNELMFTGFVDSLLYSNKELFQILLCWVIFTSLIPWKFLRDSLQMNIIFPS